MANLPPGFTDVSDDPRLRDIHRRESGDKNLPPQANVNYRLQGPQHSSASGVDQMEPGTYRDWSRKFGIGKQYSEAYQAPPNTQDALALKAYQTWGPNARNTWAASGPYKDLRQQNQQQQQLPKGWTAAGPPKSPLPKGWTASQKTPEPAKPSGPLHDRDLGKLPQTPWRVPPKFEGPRSNVRAGLNDPSIVARQQQASQPQSTSIGEAAGAEGRAMQAAPGAANVVAATKWITKNYPDLQVQDMMGDATNWTANKLQDALTEGFKKLGYDNPEAQAHGLVSDAVVALTGAAGDAPMARGFRPKADLSGIGQTEAGAASGQPGTGIPNIPGRPRIEPTFGASPNPDALGQSLTARPAEVSAPASAGAAATPRSEILREKYGQYDETKPLHELVAENTDRFDKANKAPGWGQQLSDAIKQMRSYFEYRSKFAAIARRASGENKRTAAQAKFAMEKYRSFADTWNTEDQLTLLEWLETPQAKLKQGLQLDPKAQEFVNTFHDWKQTIQKKLESMPQTEQMNFVQNFVSHLWKRPKDMMTFIHEYGARTGSNYFTKKRAFESYAEGVRAGFAPLTTNPIEIFARYVENATAKIATWDAFNFAKEDGLIKYAKPGEQPEGWQPLKDKGNEHGMQAYAPNGFAQAWNAYYDHPQPGVIKSIGDFLHTAANKSTAFRLALSAVHSGLVTFDSWGSGLGNAYTKTIWGRPVGGAWELAKSPFKPFTSLHNARQIWKIYHDSLDQYGSPQDRQIVHALTRAGFDFTREGKIADEYRASNIPGVLKLIERRGLMSEARAAGRDIAAQPVAGSIRHIMRNMTRALNILGEAQFQYYVPAIKTQAAVDLMRTYLDAFPNATQDMIDAYARQTSDKMDARFGEMNKDNIFWSQWLKKLGATAFLSYSFTYGGLKQVQRGSAGIGGFPVRLGMKMAGKLPGGVGVFNDDIGYVVGIATAYAAMTSIYQYLMTGQFPQSAQDLEHPKTGGKVMAAGKTVDERASFTNIANTIMNTLENPGSEFYNKLSPAIKGIYELAINKDWQNKEIRNTLEPWQNQAMQVIDYIFSDVTMPISYEQYQQAKAGTAVPAAQRLVGVRPSGSKITNPEDVQKAINFNAAKDRFEKLQSDDNATRARAGLPPRRIPKQIREQEIKRIMREPSWSPFAQTEKKPNLWLEHPAYGGAQ